MACNLSFFLVFVLPEMWNVLNCILLIHLASLAEISMFYNKRLRLVVLDMTEFVMTGLPRQYFCFHVLYQSKFTVGDPAMINSTGVEWHDLAWNQVTL